MICSRNSAHFNRERIPERAIHARGNPAYGIFTVTNSLKNYSVANFLHNVDQQTEVFLRFSAFDGGQGSGDYVRNPQSLHQMTILMSDCVIPLSYRLVQGFSSHILGILTMQRATDSGANGTSRLIRAAKP
jgi:catalase